MKNLPTIEYVLRWAGHLGLCGPIQDNLRAFLLEGDKESNLERIFMESQKDKNHSFSELIEIEFNIYLVQKHFQVAV